MADGLALEPNHKEWTEWKSNIVRRRMLMEEPEKMSAEVRIKRFLYTWNHLQNSDKQGIRQRPILSTNTIPGDK